MRGVRGVPGLSAGALGSESELEGELVGWFRKVRFAITGFRFGEEGAIGECTVQR